MDPLRLMIELTMKNERDIDEHLMTLFSLVLSLKPTKVVELGVRTGRSTLAFLVASQYVNCSLTSVDINDMTPDFGFPENWKENWEFIKKDALAYLERDFQILMADRKEGDPILVYIDDWHDGLHVQKELDLIDEYITPGDLIVLHDLMYDNSQPHYKTEEDPKDKQWGNGGPYKPISELDLSVWEYVTIPRCNGLTILRRKSDKIVTE